MLSFCCVPCSSSREAEITGQQALISVPAAASVAAAADSSASSSSLPSLCDKNDCVDCKDRARPSRGLKLCAEHMCLWDEQRISEQNESAQSSTEHEESAMASLEDGDQSKDETHADARAEKDRSGPASRTVIDLTSNDAAVGSVSAAGASAAAFSAWLSICSRSKPNSPCAGSFSCYLVRSDQHVVLLPLCEHHHDLDKKLIVPNLYKGRKYLLVDDYERWYTAAANADRLEAIAREDEERKAERKQAKKRKKKTKQAGEDEAAQLWQELLDTQRRQQRIAELLSQLQQGSRSPAEIRAIKMELEQWRASPPRAAVTAAPSVSLSDALAVPAEGAAPSSAAAAAAAAPAPSGLILNQLDLANLSALAPQFDQVSSQTIASVQLCSATCLPYLCSLFAVCLLSVCVRSQPSRLRASVPECRDDRGCRRETHRRWRCRREKADSNTVMLEVIKVSAPHTVLKRGRRRSSIQRAMPVVMGSSFIGLQTALNPTFSRLSLRRLPLARS